MEPLPDALHHPQQPLRMTTARRHLADLPDGRAGQPRRTSISIEGSRYLSLVEGRLVNEADRRADAIGE